MRKPRKPKGVTPKEESKLKINKAPPDFNFDELRMSALYLISEKNLSVISGLLRVTEFVRDDKAIETAAIGRINGKITILYNGDFIYTYASTPLEFSTVLLHEIMHELLGHLRIDNYPGDPNLWNLVKDIIINQSLFHLNRPASSKYDYSTSKPTVKRGNPNTGFHITKLFENLYELEGLSALLRPPAILARLRTHEKVEDSVIDKLRREVYPILELAGRKPNSNLSVPSHVTEYDLYNFISSNFQNKDYSNITIIGVMKNSSSDGENGTDKSKGEGDKKEEGSQDKGFKPGVGAQWGDFTLIDVCEELNKASQAAGYSDTELTRRTLKKLKTKSKDLELAFDQALMNGTKSKIAALLGGPPKLSRSVIPCSTISRSDLLKLSVGYWPVFFSKQIVGDKRQRAHVYIDVSGSVVNYVEWMYGCVQEIEKNTEVFVHLFSNKVFDITKEEFEKRVVRTTGGTDFDCVAVHALDLNTNQKDDKFVLFTDGFANIEKQYIKEIENRKILFIGALMGDTRERNETVLKTFCKKVFLVPKIQDTK